MVKVKFFGVIRTTTGFSYLETDAKTVNDIFEIVSRRMSIGYEEDREELERKKNDPDVKYIKPKNPALEYHQRLQFKDAVVYVNGERCMRKGKKLSDGDEIWLLSPAAGG
ncbi:MAG: MoaD/ThiS family protein [Clostridia bacterium]|nr:MoaD/ThiS family protein [Oscillospiraceae bacterium]MBQ7004896.1 MoaD/ThiS family protein [Clostridia bacterium]